MTGRQEKSGETMKLFTRRRTMMSLLAVVAGTVAATVAVIDSGSSNASPVREATPLAQAQYTKVVKAAIVRTALHDGVSPSTVVELGASGNGPQRHAVLAGKDASGASVLSFMSGFGMSEFVAGTRFADASKGMFVSESVEGPSTEVRTVGVVGIATRQVERVTVQLANGTVTTVALGRAPGVAYEGFSYVSNEASTFPVSVTGYNAGGHVVATHAVDSSPLCKATQPDCVTK
jgi:hypothetical protein